MFGSVGHDNRGVGKDSDGALAIYLVSGLRF